MMCVTPAALAGPVSDLLLRMRYCTAPSHGVLPVRVLTTALRSCPLEHYLLLEPLLVAPNPETKSHLRLSGSGHRRHAPRALRPPDDLLRVRSLPAPVDG